MVKWKIVDAYSNKIFINSVELELVMDAFLNISYSEKELPTIVEPDSKWDRHTQTWARPKLFKEVCPYENNTVKNNLTLDEAANECGWSLNYDNGCYMVPKDWEWDFKLKRWSRP